MLNQSHLSLSLTLQALLVFCMSGCIIQEELPVAPSGGSADPIGESPQALPAPESDEISEPRETREASQGEAGQAGELIAPMISILEDGQAFRGEASYLSRAGQGGPLSYMIGVYETHSDHSGGYHPMGYADVFVEAQRDDISLVLVSYEPVTWRLSGPGVSQIQRLILSGYHEQLVDAEALTVEAEYPSEIMLLHELPPAGVECQNLDLFDVLDEANGDIDAEVEAFNRYEEDENACEHERVMANLSELGIEPLNAFAGTYQASEFVIHATRAERASSGAGAPPAPPAQAPSASRVELGEFIAEYFDASQSLETPVYSERVARPSINYPWSDFHGISSEDFYAVWTGEIMVAEALTLRVSADFSWAQATIYIDGVAVLNGAYGHDLEVTAGAHQVRVEFRNQWHTTNLNVNFEPADETPEMVAQDLGDAEVAVISVYEADSLYNEIEVNVAPGDTPLFLVLGSFRDVNWMINNPTQREITGVLTVGYGHSNTVQSSAGLRVYHLDENVYDNAERLRELTQTYLGASDFTILEEYYGVSFEVE